MLIEHEFKLTDNDKKIMIELLNKDNEFVIFFTKIK